MIITMLIGTVLYAGLIKLQKFESQTSQLFLVRNGQDQEATVLRSCKICFVNVRLFIMVIRFPSVLQ